MCFTHIAADTFTSGCEDRISAARREAGPGGRLASEKGEMYAAVAACLPETGMCGELFVGRMFENEDPFRSQQIAFEYQIDDRFTAFQVVRSIREDEVELFRAALQVEEDVGLYGVEVFNTQFACCLADEVIVYRVDLHRSNTAGSA